MTETLAGPPHTFGDPRLPQRFWDKVSPLTNGCWIWTASLSHGYGQVHWEGRPRRAHCVAWSQLVGRLGKKQELDHGCHNKACVNPGHLNPVTHQQNLENRPGAQRNNMSSGIRNVYWDSARHKWDVRVQHDGRAHRAGRFVDLDEATEAARRLRCQLFTNNPADYVDGGVAA